MASKRITIADAAALLGASARALGVRISTDPKFRARLGAQKLGPIWTVEENRVRLYHDTKRRPKPKQTDEPGD